MTALVALVSLALVLADDPRRISAEAQPAVVAADQATPERPVPPPRPVASAKPGRPPVADEPPAPPVRCFARGNRCRDLVVTGAVLAPLGAATVGLGSVMFATGTEHGDRRAMGVVMLALGTGLVAVATIVIVSGVAHHRRQRRAALAAVRSASGLR